MTSLDVFRTGHTSLPPLPQALRAKYSEALVWNAPASYSGVANFPLMEGLDAVIAALDQSTSKSSSQWLPSMDEMNNLVKAHFVYECMIQGQPLRQVGGDTPWIFVVAAVLQRLLGEYSKWRRDVEENQQSLASLNPGCFRIWTIPEVSVVKLVTEPDETQGEEKIIELPLSTSTYQISKALFVFRRPSNELRLLTFVSSNQSIGGQSGSHEPPSIVNIHQVDIVPRYAMPPHPRTPPNIEICFAGASSGNNYQFKTRDDMKKFQNALLGYKIVFEEFCNWKVHCSGLFKSNKLKGGGFVQILQAKPLPSMGTSPESPRSPGFGGMAHPGRDRSDSILSDGVSIAPSMAAPSVYIKDDRKAFIAAHPHAPVLLVLTEIEGQPTYVHVRRKYCQSTL